MYQTVLEALNETQELDGIAIEGLGRKPLIYRSFHSQVRNTIDALHGMGYGRGDRIAVVLPDGPETAVALLSVVSGFTCAPLNPAYGEGELNFYLSDIKADAVLVDQEIGTPAMAVARSMGIPIISITSDVSNAGAFRLSGASGCAGHEKVPPQPDDIALLLHTSGTTSRPKLVPLLQSSVTTSAVNIARSLSLTGKDRCLNVMPLFHVHGLIGALLSTIVSGGSAICTAGYRPTDFLEWVRLYRPTWYTAVPTIHQSVLEQAAMQPDKILPTSLRFIRSASSPLPSSVARGLEDTFGVPAIEAYGMTEASHQIAANPLLPLRRKMGSVGRGTGVEIAIVDDRGELLPAGQQGQIALKGPSIIHGYENNPAANEKAFIGVWFLTGDRGHLDEEGYLFIDGRIKEIINRGGEKVSPREVEDALLAHPAVAEAAAFSVPDGNLGETVGAAVVPRPGTSVSAEDLKRFVASRLVHFKVPAKLWLVPAIPKGPTGKIQRIGLHDRLKEAGLMPNRPTAPTREPPLTPTEQTLAAIWAEVLKADGIGRCDSFLELGGDSLKATMVTSRANQAFGISLTIGRVLGCDTIAELGEVVDRMASRAAEGGTR